MPLRCLFAFTVSIFMVLLAPAGFAQTIDFTRFVKTVSIESQVDSPTNVLTESFFATKGAARIRVESPDSGLEVSISLNGTAIGSELSDGLGTDTDHPVTLQSEMNELSISVLQPTGLTSAFTVRVKQKDDVQLHVQSRVHFNTNVSDFRQAREFVGQLGFETLTGFPDTNTQAMARAIGIETPTEYDGAQGEHAGGYLLHGELVGINGYSGGVIDLIEFTIPRNEEPPYAKLNHLGMVKAAMYTANVDADYAHMNKLGVVFLSSPATRSNGDRFAVFKDQDGTFYELLQKPQASGERNEQGTHITGLGHVTIGVSDFERSRAWYKMFGYQVSSELAETESLEVAGAMGFAQTFKVRGAMVTQEVDGSQFELVQWISPFDPERAYPIPVNHYGIHRTAFATTDIVADVAALEAQGVEFLSPITPCCSGPDSWGSIVAFYDPDGTVVELVEQPWIMTQLLSFVMWMSNLF